MTFKPDTFIAANDPGLAHAVARSFLKADLAEQQARLRRMQRHKLGSFTAWRAFFGDDLIALNAKRESGERAEWMLAGYGPTTIEGDEKGAGHGLWVRARVQRQHQDFVPIAVTDHAVARMMSRTLHKADRHLVKAALDPFFRTWWTQLLIDPAEAVGLPTNADIALCCPKGALLGTEWPSQYPGTWGALLKTWVDAEGAADPFLHRTCADLPPSHVQGLVRVDGRWEGFITVDTTDRSAET